MSDTKNDFLEEMKKQFDELNYHWTIERNKFETKAQHVTAEAKKQFEAEREEFRKFRKEMQEKIVDLDVASDNAWEDLKEGSEQAWTALSESFKKAVSHFK